MECQNNSKAYLVGLETFQAKSGRSAFNNTHVKCYIDSNQQW